MPHINAVPWDADILAKLATDPYNKMPQDGSADVEMSGMMNAEEVSVIVAFPWVSAKKIAQAYGDWPNIVIRSEERPADATVKAAINAVSLDDGQVIDPSNVYAWKAFEAGMSVLHASGDLSDAAIGEIGKLPVSAIPWWQSINASSPLNEHDLARAREV